MKKEGLLKKLDLLFIPTSFVRDVNNRTKDALDFLNKEGPGELAPLVISSLMIKNQYILATAMEAVRIATYGAISFGLYHYLR